ncbi:coiled-coil domain-containing protein 158-like isoform X3 [Solea solea]|uniref:coiled-coil domain-containing protein 158-like isoform X3 n=1 Tax=Solea solea TaxID=90069 RepID=UPI00272B61D7|nr:coiled-coil domain-containing protein 158-like isoform X3 [Solea solea]
MAGIYDAPVLKFDSLSKHDKLTQAAAAGATEPHDTSPLLRFNSMTLDELSEELGKRTKETQRLQEEVENATKLALERFGCTYDINSSPGQSCHNYRFKVYDTPEDFTNQPQDCGLDLSKQDVFQRQTSTPRKDELDNAIDDCCQHLPDLQTHDQPEQETISLDKAIENLQTKLHQVQMDKVVTSDLRLRDSRKHVDQMEQMLHMLEELQNIKRATDQKLQDTEDETLLLSRKVETLEQLMKETYSSMLSDKKQYGNVSDTSQNTATHLRLPYSDATLTEDLNNERDQIQERILLTIGHLETDDCSVNEQKQRMKELIASLCQEMALLSDKLSSSNYDSFSVGVKLELLRKLAERQTSLNQCQVHCLEQQLLRVQSQLVEAQREREQTLQQFEELQFQLGQLKTCSKKQQCELQVEIKALRGWLVEAKEQLCRGEEEKNCLQALLDARTQEVRKTQELLREKDDELQLRQQEAQQHRSQCHTFQGEGEMLRLKLDDREKLIDGLRLRMESGTQMALQHSHTIDNLHQQNSFLSNQLNQNKLEIQHIRAELDQSRSDVATAEHEKRQLQASVAEQRQRVQEETLEKQHKRLLSLTKEHEELQRFHSCKNDEQEGVVLRLQGQLRTTCDELDQVRSTLRTLEGADGHGLQVAMNMQKEITARREQVDTLQGKIQHLEDTMDKLYQEKQYQNLEHHRQLRKLTFVREEKKQLANELEALHSKDQQLRERIGKLEAILHKISESFADCQDFIQLQEQEFYRLKLQHALDLKEFQGQTLHTALKVPPPDLDSLNSSALIASPSSQHTSNTQIKASLTQELRSVVKELRAVISENHRPHTDNSNTGTSLHRRRSAPERVHRTSFHSSADKAVELKGCSRLRRKTSDCETHFLRKAELDGNRINKETISKRCVESGPAKSFLQFLSLGRRSPVHSLLTSNPNI